MKRAMPLIMIVAFPLLSGCASQKAAYESRVRLIPQADGQTYAVDFRIEDPSGESVFITTPRLLVFEGQEGKVHVGDDKLSVSCSAVVNDGIAGPRAKVSIDIEENGETVWSETKTVAAKE